MQYNTNVLLKIQLRLKENERSDTRQKLKVAYTPIYSSFGVFYFIPDLNNTHLFVKSAATHPATGLPFTDSINVQFLDFLQ